MTMYLNHENISNATEKSNTKWSNMFLMIWPKPTDKCSNINHDTVIFLWHPVDLKEVDYQNISQVPIPSRI